MFLAQQGYVFSWNRVFDLYTVLSSYSCTGKEWYTLSQHPSWAHLPGEKRNACLKIMFLYVIVWGIFCGGAGVVGGHMMTVLRHLSHQWHELSSKALGRHNPLMVTNNPTRPVCPSA